MNVTTLRFKTEALARQFALDCRATGVYAINPGRSLNVTTGDANQENHAALVASGLALGGFVLVPDLR
jgi:hypothetical protein